jgi:tRNA threonylcarbamoyladenosine biosynthesis protein TsaE
MALNISMAHLFKKAPALEQRTVSEDETRDLARHLGKHLKPGDWVALVGELGTGKTLFVKGLGEALHCRDTLASPTFSLVRVHRAGVSGKTALRHVDLYRLNPQEIPTLEWEEILDTAGVTVVEWAEKAMNYWPSDCLVVGISHMGDNRRSLSFYPTGTRAMELVQTLKKDLKSRP